MEPTWYTPPIMAKYRYRVVLTAEYICVSYCIFCGNSSTWADSMVSASAAKRRVMKRQALSPMIPSP
jgi:L-lysine 2,3-aminomutase